MLNDSAIILAIHVKYLILNMNKFISCQTHSKRDGQSRI
jgi:hypothetical protein